MSASPTADTVDSADAPWPEIEPRLLHGNRPPPPGFPVERLPEAWRPWIEAQAQGLTGADYLAQGLLGAVAAVCGARIVAGVTPHWREPLVLWQALVGEPSTGKTPALVLARRLVEAVDPERETWTRLVQIDPSLDMLARLASRREAGVALWCDDLAGWLADNSRPGNRRLALAGWAGDAAHVPDRGDYMSMEVDRFPLCILGTLQADRLTPFLNGDIDGMASRNGTSSRRTPCGRVTSGRMPRRSSARAARPSPIAGPAASPAGCGACSPMPCRARRSGARRSARRSMPIRRRI